MDNSALFAGTRSAAVRNRGFMKLLKKIRLRLLPNIDLVKASRIAMLVICDIALINAASFLALWIRFEFSVQDMLQSGFLPSIIANALPYTAAAVAVIAAMRLYVSLWEYAGFDEFVRICIACILIDSVGYLGLIVRSLPIPRSYPVLNGMFLVLFIAGLRFSYRFIRKELRSRANKGKRTMLIGAGEAAFMALREFSSSRYSQNDVICLIDDDVNKQGRYLCGVRIVGGEEYIEEAVRKFRIDEIIFAIPSASPQRKKELLSTCQRTGCKLKTLPGLFQLANGEVTIQQIRNVEIEDLLGRDVVDVDISGIMDYVHDRVVLVTGGGGSIGSELCRQLAAHMPKQLIVLDIYENNAYAIEQELKADHPDLSIHVLIGSVRDEKRLADVFSRFRPELVFHAAAHKHVPLMEASPLEAIKNNVFGTLNVANCADRFGAKRMLLIGTDKAVRPTNIMGATKRICEMIVQMMNGSSQTEYVAVRFGNVLGSNGSVIPLFKKQIEAGGPVTVTHKDIIRYFMTIREAVALVLQAGAYAKGGEIFVLDMGDPVRIDDLARNMIKLSGFEPDVDIPIRYIGLRPGEKLFEELLLAEKGMKRTPNELIYIGQPLHFDDETLRKELADLKQLCNNSGEEAAVYEAVKRIVPEYSPSKTR